MEEEEEEKPLRRVEKEDREGKEVGGEKECKKRRGAVVGDRLGKLRKRRTKEKKKGGGGGGGTEWLQRLERRDEKRKERKLMIRKDAERE